MPKGCVVLHEADPPKPKWINPSCSEEGELQNAAYQAYSHRQMRITKAESSRDCFWMRNGMDRAAVETIAKHRFLWCWLAVVSLAVMVQVSTLNGWERASIVIIEEIEETTANCNTTTALAGTTPEDHVVVDPSSSMRAVSKNKKPNFVMHVGPSKTGTTAIQEALHELRPELNEDNWTYEGKYLEAKSTEFFRAARAALKAQNCAYAEDTMVPEKNMTYCWDEVKSHLDDFRNEGQNVVISDEALLWSASFDFDMFQKIFEDWNVLVVVSYRRLWEWLVSRRNQSLKILYGGRLIRPDWPKTRLETLPEWLNTRLRTLRWTNTTLRRYTESVLARYHDEFNTVVLNVHDTDRGHDIVSVFVCDILPHANGSAACKASLQRETDHKSNPSVDISYDLIACDAAMNNYFNTGCITRRKAGEAVKLFHESELDSAPLPLTCVGDNALESLFEASVAMEEKLVGTFHKRYRASHRDEFDAAIRSNFFCSVDTNKVRNDNRWKVFLQSLSCDMEN